MTDVRVTVRGSHRSAHPAEHGTVNVTIGLEGPTPEPVYDGVARSSDQVIESVRRLHDAEQGPVIWWASEQLRTWTERPWSNDGARQSLVHHGQVDLRVRFTDFAVLSRWVSENIAAIGFTVGHIEWTLTDARRTALVDKARVAAVVDARSKAQAYADALGLGPVVVQELADAGMLGATEIVGGSPVRLARMVAGESSVQFAPEDIEVVAEVDAVFVAAPPAAT